MYLPKEDIYSIISNITYGGELVPASEGRPEVISTFPSITYEIGNNKPVYTVEGEIGYQEVEVIVDIWANTSEDSEGILSLLEEAMRSSQIMLSFSGDIPDPNGGSHISNRFNFKA